MPEDLSSFIETELEGVNETPEEEVVDENVAEPIEQEEDIAQEPQEETKEEATNKAFAALRAENAKYNKFFNTVAEKTGATPDEVMELLQGQLTEAEAKQLNTDPAVLRRLQEQEEKLREYETRNLETAVVNNLQQLKTDLSLNDKDMESFVKTLVDNEVDIFTTNVDLKTLYNGFNHDRIIKDAVEAAKQEFMKGQSKADSASLPDKQSGSKDDKDRKVINNMQDLNSLLSSLK